MADEKTETIVDLYGRHLIFPTADINMPYLEGVTNYLTLSTLGVQTL